MTQPPRPVRPGEPITARLFNALRDMLVRSRIVKVDGGLLMKQSDAGITLALSAAPDPVRWARVTSDYPPDPADPAETTYSVQILSEGRVIDNLKPVNRVVAEGDGRKIIPVPKGSLCAVVFPRAKKGLGGQAKHLLIFGEVSATKVCTPGGDGGGSIEARLLAIENAILAGQRS